MSHPNIRLVDRAKETTTTTGSGTVNLGGAVAGFVSISGVGNGNSTYYTLEEGNNFEVGIGTYTSAGNTLSRDEVYSSSNSDDSKINLAGGASVFITYPAEKAVVETSGSYVGIGGIDPEYQLAVSGTGSFNTVRWADGTTQTTAATDTTYTAGTGLTLVGTEFNTDGTGYFTHLGIGTGAPTYTLDVAGDMGVDEYIYHNGDGNTFIRFAPDLVNLVAGGASAIKLEKSTGKIQLNNSNQDLDIEIMAADGEVILHTDATTNNVGIGITDPGYNLAVSGTGSFNTVRWADGTTQTTASTDTTYTAGTGLSLAGTEFNISGIDSTMIVDGSVSNSDLANSSLTVTAGTGLSNGGAVALGASIIIDADTATTSQVGVVQLQDSATDGTTDKAITPNAVYDISGVLSTSIASTGSTNAASIATNTTNIATNVTNIASTGATNSAAISTVSGLLYDSWTLQADGATTTSVDTTETVRFTGAGNTSVTLGGTDNRVVTISGSAGGGGAPTDAQYVTLALDGDLSAERVLAASTGVHIVDGGANGNVAVSVSGSTTAQLGIVQLQDSATNGTTDKAITPNAVYDISGVLSSDIQSTGESNYNLVRSYVDTSDNATFNNLTAQGNLTVSGTLTYLDSTTVTIADKQLELASNSGTPIGNDSAVNDGGIVVKSTDSDKKWTWLDATDAWTSTEHISLNSSKNIIFGDGTEQSTSPTGDISTVSGLTVTNASNIASTGATNAANIATNTSNISTNTTNIASTGATNAARITTNTSNISTNTTNIASTGATNAADIDTVSGLLYGHWTLRGDAATTTNVDTTETVQFTGVGTTSVTLGGTDNRTVTISGGGGGGGAPTDAQYVTLATDGDLSAERVLAGGTGIGLADGGANGNITVSITGASTSNTGIAYYSSDNFSVSAGYQVSIKDGGVSNDELGGSIANSKLANSSVSYGGVSLSLGGSDATPAFNLSDATGYPTSSLVGTITNSQLAGSIANGKLANDSVTVTAGSGLIHGGEVDLGSSITIDAVASTTAQSGIVQLQDSATNGTTNRAITPNAVYDISGVLSTSIASTGATNAANIATNTSNISTNTSNISTNTTNIASTGATNATAIATKAPKDSQYVTLALDGDLSAERVLVGGTGVKLTDGGANGNVTVHITGASTSNTGIAYYSPDNFAVSAGHQVTIKDGGVSSDELAGSIANSKLANSSVSYGGVSLSLGGSDAHPAFNVADATGYPTTSLVGTITNAQLAGSIVNAKLSNSSVTITAGTGLSNGGSVALGASVSVDADTATTSAVGVVQLQDSATNGTTNRAITPNAVYDISGVLQTNIDAAGGAPTDAQYVTLATDGDLSAERVLAGGTGIGLADGGANGNITVSITGASTSNTGIAYYSPDNFAVSAGYQVTIKDGGVSNDELAGSIPNSKLANSSVNFGGVSLSLGGSDTTPAFNLSDATAYKTTNLDGTITNAQLAGSIANDKLANSAITVNAGTGLSNGGSVALGASVTVDADTATTSAVGVVQLQDSATNGTVNRAITPNAVYDISGVLQTKIDAGGGGGGSPGGSNTQVQFNDSSSFGGDADLTWNKTTNVLTVAGHIAATTKSFLIDHPVKENKKLQYASLEGPENGVYVRGHTTSHVIELPDYWVALVDHESITVHLTPKGKPQPSLCVNRVAANKVYLSSDQHISAYYTVSATRKDVPPLEVEI